MIRFADLVALGTPSPNALAAYEAAVPPHEAAAARALLTGTRPKRMASAETLLALVAEAIETPAFLIEACRSVTPDKSELAALLLPAAQGEPPTLTEALAVLQSAEPAQYLSLAHRLPPKARMVFNRLATGSFRTRLPTLTQATLDPGTCLAILTMIAPSGPEATLALPHGNGFVPLTKLHLTLPETAEILTWTRAHTTDRFGPLRQVTPTLVFELTFEGRAPNLRRKCGFDLVAPRLICWHRDLTPDRVPSLTLQFPKT
ncbi:MAG: hypothetical protein ACOH2H_01645 [Cypionkella sp.]